MSTERISEKRARRDGGHRLRVRGVLFEDAKARRKFKRKTQKPLHEYDLEQLALFVALLAFAAEGGTIEQLRIIKGAPSEKKAMLKRLLLMRDASPSGRLVALVVPLPELNHLPLKDVDTLEAAKTLLSDKLTHVDLSRPHSAALKRGGKFDGTHAHFCCQAESLSFELLALALASPVGKGGGGLHDSGIHVCLVGDSENDLERLSSYLSRDGDEALHLDDQDSFEYLAALERKVVERGKKSPQLIWHYPKRISAL